MSLANPSTPLGRLYVQHIAAAGALFENAAGISVAERGERITQHLCVADGIVGTAKVLFDAETFEAFQRDVGLDRDPARLSAHLKSMFDNLPAI